MTAAALNPNLALYNQMIAARRQQNPVPGLPSPVSSPPLMLENIAITRMDFFENPDGTVTFQKLGQTPASGDRPVVLTTDTKPLDLAAVSAWLNKHGYCTRRWQACTTNTFTRPAGMRAWHGPQPYAIRSPAQIAKLRRQLTAARIPGEWYNLAYDL